MTYPLMLASGYGSQPYGLGPYGSVFSDPPQILSVTPLDGFTLQVVFDRDMGSGKDDPANYTLTPTLGAPVQVQAVDSSGPDDTVVLYTSGTTLGGSYTLAVTGVQDTGGSTINDSRDFLALGGVSQVEVTPLTEGIEIQFRSELGAPLHMLPESEVSPGILDPNAYVLTTEYPAVPLKGTPEHPVGGDASKVLLPLSNFTSASYELTVGPADSINYEGDVLPSEVAGFDAHAVGTGSSVIQGGSLVLSKPSDQLYGWVFEDTIGNLNDNATFRYDFEVDFSSVGALSLDPFATLIITDGVRQVNLVFDSQGSTPVLTLESAPYFDQVGFDWRGLHTFTLLRNMRGEFLSLLVNGEPLLTTDLASLGGFGGLGAGLAFFLNPGYEVEALPIHSVSVSASQTLYSATWNFIHNLNVSFQGLGLGSGSILTEKGPLVKGWGDATPATAQDVQVRLNGVPVPVAQANPYRGEIFLQTPIPKAPAGTNTVEVDYQWMSNPTFPAYTNILGSDTNKSDVAKGNHAPSTPPTTLGAASQQRFPYTVVRGPILGVNPLQVGHRFLAYEKAYSALTNSPTTLLTNQDPHRFSKPEMEADCRSQEGFWDATSAPPPPWSLMGSDTGSPGEVEGTYLIEDSSAGSTSYQDIAYYYQDIPATCDRSTTVLGRFRVEDYTPDGVFTGIGMGFHDNDRVYLMGLLVINGLRHLGVLLDAENDHLEQSWQVGPQVLSSILDSHTLEAPASVWPSTVMVGDQFQILEGPQAGVYTIAQCGIDAFDGRVRVTITESFPADPSLEGNDTAQVVLQTKWDESILTYRVQSLPGHGVTVFLGGTLSGEALRVEEVPPMPSETSLMIPTGDQGRVFFGSFSPRATNQTVWSFARFDSASSNSIRTTRGFVVDVDMTELPEERDIPWFITNGFGDSEVLGSELHLRSTSRSDVLDLTYGYSRLEPFLSRPNKSDVDVTFRVGSAYLHATTVLRVRDDLKTSQVAALLFRDTGTGHALVRLPSVSVSGLHTLDQDGWQGGGDFGQSVRGNLLTFNKAMDQEGVWFKDMSVSGMDMERGRALEARWRVLSYDTPDLTGTFAAMNLDLGGQTYTVGFSLQANPDFEVCLTSDGDTVVASFPFAWDDLEYHRIRIVADTVSDVVSLFVDGVLLGTVPLTSFDTTTESSSRVYLGMVGQDRQSEMEWDSLSVTGLPLASYRRTLGVWTGGSTTDINSWRVPRVDGTDAPNSSPNATIEDWDWSQDISFRLRLDPDWGASLYRPDLPPPPTFSGGAYVNLNTDPTGAWINVGYSQLPRHHDVVGSVSFGSLDPQDISTQTWGGLRYRIYNTPDENYFANRGMVRNRYNVVHSSELNVDVAPIKAEVTSLTPTMISLRSLGITVDRVFFLFVDDLEVSRDLWDFDATTQTVALLDPLPQRQYPVTVVFAPGFPVTEEYLRSLPLESSITLLNEDTPPMVLSQVGTASLTQTLGVSNNDPAGATATPDPTFTSNNPWQVLEWALGGEVLYQEVTHLPVDNKGETGRLSPLCDDTGLVALAIERYEDRFEPAPVFDTTRTFMPAGGVHPGTLVAGGERTQSGVVIPVIITTRGEVFSALDDRYEDALLVDDLLGDGVSPSGGVSPTGVADYVMVDPGGDAISRPGPWGGLSTLTPHSIIGGGSLLDGSQFTPVGGSVLPSPVVTEGVAQN